jgi:hypothetical protein
MTKYSVTVPKSKTLEVLNFLNNLRGVKVEEQTENEIVMQNWHKKILDEELVKLEKGEKGISLRDFKIRAKKHL